MNPQDPLAKLHPLREPAAIGFYQKACDGGDTRACRRLTVTAPGSEIGVEDIPAELGGSATGASRSAEWSLDLTRWAERQLDATEEPLLDSALPEFEKTVINVALARAKGRRQEAARLLGWGRNTLTRKIKELGLEDAG